MRRELWFFVVVGMVALALSACGKEGTGDSTKDAGPLFPPNQIPEEGQDETPEPEEGEDAEPIPGEDAEPLPTPDGGPVPDGLVPADDVVFGEDAPPVLPGCVDNDKDMYGDGCYLGKDCDDNNKNFTVYCPPCETQNVQGCKCYQEGLAEVCYEGDPGSVGIGMCQLGQRHCLQGFWTACLGQVVPVAEVCDELDNDCDGDADEGVLSPCGNCDPLCDTLTIGPGSPIPFDVTDQNSDGVGTNLDGYIVLDSSQIDLSFIWVANSGESTVSKLDTETGAELGRYKTCGDPSRTAVDLVGNVWVGCRSGGGVAKIAIDEAICLDKNGNGTIETSHGSEVLGPSDECILFIVYPGGSCQRALGVDSENHAWVGEWNGATLRRLHPDDGHVVSQVGIPDNPYGLAIDGTGVIWVSGRGGGKLVRVDPNNNPPTVNAWGVPYGDLYGIAVDAKGKVWLGQFSQGKIARFDPDTSSFQTITQSLGGHCPRGMAGSVDGYMYSGLGCGGDHYVARVDINTLAVSLIDTNGSMGSGTTTIGVALDAKGFIWGVNYSTSNASKIDPATHQVHGPYKVGANPYTYSDMTGYALHNFTAPQGFYATQFGGWEGFRVKWSALYVDAEIPDTAYLKLEVRTGQNAVDVESKPWQGMYGPYPPDFFPLDLTQIPDMDGPILQVKVWLFSKDKMSTPIIKAIKAKFEST
jgi:streptogramin lyase